MQDVNHYAVVLMPEISMQRSMKGNIQVCARKATPKSWFSFPKAYLKKNRISAAKTSLPHILSFDIRFGADSRSAAGHGGSREVAFSLFSGGMLIRVGFGIKNDG
jgi:hypothetical protein